MITMLLAAACIATCGLEVSIGYGANPDVGPSRWNCQRLDPRELFGITQFLSMGIQVSETFARPLAGVAGGLISDISQATRARTLSRSCRERRNVWHLSQTHKGE